MNKTNKILSRLSVAALLGVGAFVVLAAAPPVAEAQTCPGGQVFGVACHACYNPGTQTCCAAGNIQAAGTQCPIPSSVRPTATSTSTAPQRPGSIQVAPQSRSCAGTWRCPGVSQITIARSPLPPTTTWSVGQIATAHATVLDEADDSEIDTSKVDGLMTCKYGNGASIVSVTMKRNTNGMTCSGLASGPAATNGFCCR